jgi:integrase/recombinase XerD
MRIGELLNTRVEDINLREQCVQIIEAEKNRVGRVVYLSADAKGALSRWMKIRKRESEYLFYGRAAGPLGYEAARAVFKHCLDKASLAHKGYTLHCLRHTYASELLNAAMPLQCLQELLGHKSIEMTRRYARLTDNTRREAYYKAMTIIEAGGINGHYRFDHQLS